MSHLPAVKKQTVTSRTPKLKHFQTQKQCYSAKAICSPALDPSSAHNSTSMPALQGCFTLSRHEKQQLTKAKTHYYCYPAPMCRILNTNTDNIRQRKRENPKHKKDASHIIITNTAQKKTWDKGSYTARNRYNSAAQTNNLNRSRSETSWTFTCTISNLKKAYCEHSHNQRMTLHIQTIQANSITWPWFFPQHFTVPPLIRAQVCSCNQRVKLVLNYFIEGSIGSTRTKGVRQRMRYPLPNNKTKTQENAPMPFQRITTYYYDTTQTHYK